METETPLSPISPAFRKRGRGTEKSMCVRVRVSGGVCMHTRRYSSLFISKRGGDEASGCWVTGRRSLGKGLLRTELSNCRQTLSNTIGYVAVSVVVENGI